MSPETLDLAIVTSCHNYGRYLPAWARSIAEQRGYEPKRVAIVDNGSTDATWPRVIEATEILEAAGIETRSKRIPFADFGTARNAAVELGGEDVEWVQHLDADDALLPYALSDFAKLAPEADVVGFGYVRFGNLKAGPKNRTRTYSKHRGEATLRSSAPCSGVSPFRRSFWERSPYRTDLIGGWDTALWIGFAHLDARFVPTARPVFKYRQHADSIFNRRRKNPRRTHFAGAKFRNLRRGYEGVSVVIPYREAGGERERALDFVQAWYAEHHPDWEVVVGVSDDPDWRKGRAVDAGVAEATGWTLVIADGDLVVDPDRLREAVAVVESGVPWVVPHEKVYRLDEEATDRIYEAGPAEAEFDPTRTIRTPYKGFAGGGLLVVDRSNFEASGGIPDVFKGWGAEDEALALILDSLVGPHVRFDAPLFHLYHPPGRRTKDPRYKQNRKLYRLLLRLAPDPDGLFDALSSIREGRDPEDAFATAGGRGTLMVAVVGHYRETRWIEKGETFRATDEERKRHAARPAKLARPVRPGDAAAIYRHSPGRTLDIRAEQALRNAAARKEREEAVEEMKAKRPGAL